ncbi:PCMD domain-containing protein [Elizabethkingia anophelis]|nr:PCMD domain-containing protein [Elizabethkingia anophelis]
MKIKNFMYLVILATSLLFISCIREQSQNMEADIETATVANAKEILQVEPIITDNSITFRLKEYTDKYLFSPEFTLTTGARINPASGTLLDFNKPQKYTVTSEDGVWKKEYTVSFIIDNSERNHYPFEYVDIIETETPKGKFHKFFDYLADGQKKYDWATANEGYNMLAASLLGQGEVLTPAFYPTAQTPEGYIKKGVKLQTKNTGPLGGMFGSPLAAGNFFLGNFKMSIPAVKSTLFGVPYNFKTAPKSIKRYFKYKAGKDFTVNSKTGTNLTKDTWGAYAILFEKSDKNNFLSGDHAFKDPRMVSVAQIKADRRIETDNWTAFELTFENISGKSFDSSKEYMYTIVFTSSLEGAIFNGAIGSTLWIDEVSIVTE